MNYYGSAHTHTQAGTAMPVVVRINPGINLTRFDAARDPLLASLREQVLNKMFR